MSVSKKKTIKGKVFCFTGKLSMVRREVELLVKKHGGRSVKSVSRNTDVLVCGGVSETNKLSAAKGFKIEQWSEKDFFDAVKYADQLKEEQQSFKHHSKKKKQEKCWYGKECYHKDIDHWLRFQHPKDCPFRPKSLQKSHLKSEMIHELSSSELNHSDGDGTDGFDGLSEKEDEDQDESAKDTASVMSVDDETRKEEQIQRWTMRLDTVSELDDPSSLAAVNSKLANKTCVLTGWFPLSRSQMIDWLGDFNAKVTADIDDETELLICGLRPGNKLFRAMEYGVPMISLPQLEMMLGLEEEHE